MNVWNSVKRRMQSKRAKAVKKKAVAAGKLVAAGAVLTGGSMLLEEMVKPSEPQIAGHDNVYATYNGATLFEYKTLAKQDNDGVTTAEIIGYIIFILLAILLIVPCIRAIIKIKKMCGQDVSAFNWICPNKDNNNTHKASYKVGPPEKTFDDLNNNSILNPQPSEHNLEEAIKKAHENFAALTSIKDSRTVKPLT